MDKATLREIRAELDEFLSRFDDCFVRRESREYLGVYVRGQLGPLERKSVEPIALDADVHPKALLHRVVGMLSKLCLELLEEAAAAEA